MRMAAGADESAMVVMPTKPTFQRLAPLSLPLPTPSTDTHSTHELQATPDNSGSKKKKRRSADDGSTTDEEGDMSKTLYECRFCKMRFAKSQALGGHMNRHRQEREKEQYQHAQELVSSMAQQQMPRTWSTMAAELNGPSGAGAAPGALSSRPDGSRPQLPPQISFNSTRLPITMTSSPSIPDSPSSNYYLPSNSSSNNLQHLQWSVDGFNANHATLPRSASQQGLNALDTMTGAMRDDFLSGVLQPRHDAGSFGCQAQFTNTMTVPVLNLRAGLGGAGPGSFQESIQGGSGTSGLQYGHDHQTMRMNDVLRQLACTSSQLSSSLMQSCINPNLDAKPPATALDGVRTSVSGPTFLMQCNNIVQFKQPQISRPGPRPLGNPTAGQYRVKSPPSMFAGHSFNNPLGAPSFGSLPGSHGFNALQDYENNLNPGTQGQYAVSRPAVAQTSSGIAASGSFGVSASHDQPQGVFGHVKMQPDESDCYNHLCPESSQMGSTEVQPQLQIKSTSIMHEVVEGNHCESVNVTTVAESGDFSGLSAPARYQSTDFSSRSPEWRTQSNSPSAQVNDSSPPSLEYCSG